MSLITNPLSQGKCPRCGGMDIIISEWYYICKKCGYWEANVARQKEVWGIKKKSSIAKTAQIG